MFENEGRVLLILSQDVLDQTRVLAGRATVALKLPVSLQIVLRALLEVGLQAERGDHGNHVKEEPHVAQIGIEYLLAQEDVPVRP